MNSAITSRSRGGKAGLCALAVITVLAGLLAFEGVSRASETHTITMDNGRLTMGYVFLDNQIMPADTPGPLPPIPNASPSGTVTVEVDGSSATVAEADFKMPVVWIPDPTMNGAPIPMTFGPVGDMTGTWNAGTGKLALTGTLRVNVYTGWDGGGPKICQFNAPDTTWSTDPNAISPGVPFNTPQGLDGNGAISAYWLDLSDGVSINGGACGKPNAVVHDPGAVWLSSGIAHFPAPPTCQEQGKDGLWPDCKDPEFPPPDPEAVISSLKMTPAKATIKAGKKVALKVQVSNTGDAPGNVTVSLKLNRSPGVKLAKQVSLQVPAGKTASASAVFKTTSKAKGQYKVTAKGAGKSDSSVITVKKRR